MSDNILNETTLKVLSLLSEKSFCSGSEMAEQLSISRTAVWKHIKLLNDHSYIIDSVASKGYQLKHPIQPLLASKIIHYLFSMGAENICDIEVCSKVGSTNDRLKRLGPSNSKPQICVAEQQTKGRGRFKRHWHSPFGENIYLSIKSSLSVPFSKMSGFSLVICLALIDGLIAFGFSAERFQIKWPNDLLLGGKKLAGILIELSGEVDSGVQTIIGIGLNVMMQKAKIDKEWISLNQFFNDSIDRNKLIAYLIDAIFKTIEQFEKHGFSYFKKGWQTYDLLNETFVELSFCNKSISGWYEGIDDQGNILIKRKDDTVESYSAGEVSFRKI